MSSRADSYRLIGYCCMLSLSVNFQYAFSSTYTNTAEKSFHNFINASFIKHHKQLSASTYSLVWNCIVNVWFVGFFIGIWLARWITDSYGRKPALTIGALFNVVGSVFRCVSIIIYQPILLVAARFICSVSTSLSYCALVLYLQEITPGSKRGFASCLNGNIFSFIAILGITIGNDQLLGKHLVYYLGLAIVPCLISFVTLLLLPETPKYLISRGKLEDAENSILFYHGKSTDSSETLKTLQFDVDHSSCSETRAVNLWQEKHLRNALYLALAAIQNTVALWTILLSSTYYLEQSGLEANVAQWSSTVMAVAYFAGTTTSVFTIERFGRRPLLLWSNVFNMGSLIFYTIFAQLETVFQGARYGCLLMFAIFGYSFGAGVGPISRFVGAELVPLNYRSLLTCIAFAENTVINVITSFSCRPLFQVVGPYAFIILYVVPSIFCTFYMYLYLPETKGKDIQEIMETLESQ